MTNRAEQVEACRACWDSEVRTSQQWARVLMTVKDAATTLTRDGELRERLEKLVERQLARGEGCMTCHFVNEGPYAPVMCGGCQARMQLADELSALLKE